MGRNNLATTCAFCGHESEDGGCSKQQARDCANRLGPLDAEDVLIARDDDDRGFEEGVDDRN